jgi:hypothetical protein
MSRTQSAATKIDLIVKRIGGSARKAATRVRLARALPVVAARRRRVIRPS